MTRISNYLAGRQINNVLSQVRVVDVPGTIGLYRIEGVATCQAVDLIAHRPRSRGGRVVTPSFFSGRCIYGCLQGECRGLTPAGYFIPGLLNNKLVPHLGQVGESVWHDPLGTSIASLQNGHYSPCGVSS